MKHTAKKITAILLITPLFWGVGCKSKEEKIAEVYKEFHAEMADIRENHHQYPKELRLKLIGQALENRDRQFKRLGYDPPNPYEEDSE